MTLFVSVGKGKQNHVPFVLYLVLNFLILYLVLSNQIKAAQTLTANTAKQRRATATRVTAIFINVGKIRKKKVMCLCLVFICHHLAATPTIFNMPDGTY
jgi:uncharacterized membrane protein